MTEAVNAITQYAIKQLKMKRVAITCDIDNVRSKKIPQRLGFQLESTLKANRLKPLTDEVSSRSRASRAVIYYGESGLAGGLLL